MQIVYHTLHHHRNPPAAADRRPPTTDRRFCSLGAEVQPRVSGAETSSALSNPAPHVGLATVLLAGVVLACPPEAGSRRAEGEKPSGLDGRSPRRGLPPFQRGGSASRGRACKPGPSTMDDNAATNRRRRGDLPRRRPSSASVLPGWGTPAPPWNRRCWGSFGRYRSPPGIGALRPRLSVGMEMPALLGFSPAPALQGRGIALNLPTICCSPRYPATRLCTG